MRSVENGILYFSSITKLPGKKPMLSYPEYSTELKGKKVGLFHFQLQNTLFPGMAAPSPH